MKKLQTFKDHAQELQLYTGRAILALIGIGFLLLIIISRLFYLQIYQHETYNTLSNNNRVNVMPIVPNRGLIFDRKGRVLADNMPAYSLEIIPEQVDNLEETILKLNRIIKISQQDKDKFYKLLSIKRRFEGVPIRYKLNEQELAAFAVNRYQLPGVDISAGLIRHYPYGEALAHTLGYVGRINETELKQLDATNYSATQYIGKTGIEKHYENTLHGQVGYQQVETNARGRVVRILNKTLPTSGKNIYLHLDLDLQLAAMKALKDKRGSIVLMDINSGGILAIASNPSFNPNLFVTGIDEKSYHNLQYSPDQPLFNRALRGQYPPGSTIKPMLGLKALELGIINGREEFFDPGWYQIEGEERLYRDWRRKGHGVMTLVSAITESCSTYFYDLADKMGIKNITEVLNTFGFGQYTDIDIASEAKGLVPSKQWKYKKTRQTWFPGETLITGIGQGYTLVTPIQLVQAAAILANQGRLVQPHIAAEVRLGKSVEIPTFAKYGKNSHIKINSEYAWQMIKKAMVTVTQSPHGTAYWTFHNAKYKVAGKTGTAQVSTIAQGEEYEAEKLEKKLRDHSLFIGYMPAEKPEVAIAVVLENEKGSSKIARNVFDAFYKSEYQNS